MQNQEPETPEIIKDTVCPSGYYRVKQLRGSDRIVNTDYCSSTNIVKNTNWRDPESEMGYENRPGITFGQFYARFNKHIYGIKKDPNDYMTPCPENYKAKTLYQRVIRNGAWTTLNLTHCVKDENKIRAIYNEMYGN